MNRKQKANIGFLLVLMVIGAFLETIVVSLVMPLVTVIMNPNMIHDNKWLKMIYDCLGCKTDNGFLITIIITMIVGYAFKNIFLYFMYYQQAKFVTENQFKMSKQLLSNFLNKKIPSNTFLFGRNLFILFSFLSSLQPDAEFLLQSLL